MPAYIVNWNPTRADWDELETDIALTRQGEPPTIRWSSGTTRQIPVGSRIYLLRQGKQQPGFMGSGWSVGEVYPDEHWDDTRDDLAYFVKWVPDVLLDPSTDALMDPRSFAAPLNTGHWTPQASGTRVPTHLERDLEAEWQRHTGHIGSVTRSVGMSSEEGALTYRLTLLRQRERALRDAKILVAKKAHPEQRIICEVPGCGFDFAAVYGEIGRDFAEVHHVLPLASSDNVVVTTLDDLVVVCANCHRMIHRGGECRDWRRLVQANVA